MSCSGSTREGDEADRQVRRQIAVQARHARRHHRAGGGAAGEDEVGDPGLAGEVLEADRAAVAVGQREVGTLARAPAAAPGGRSRCDGRRRDTTTSASHQQPPDQAAARPHAVLLAESTRPPRRRPAARPRRRAAPGRQRHRDRDRRPGQAACPAAPRAVERPAQGGDAVGQRVEPHQRARARAARRSAGRKSRRGATWASARRS